MKGLTSGLSNTPFLSFATKKRTIPYTSIMARRISLWAPVVLLAFHAGAAKAHDHDNGAIPEGEHISAEPLVRYAGGAATAYADGRYRIRYYGYIFS